MGNISNTPRQDAALSATPRQSRLLESAPADPDPGTVAGSGRLQVICDLVRSGRYHVPATAIADRMIEQMAVVSRRPAC